MIKKEQRLRKKKEIENVFKKGKSFYNDLLGIKILKNNLNFNRYCIVISANISKKAVERNKIRRQIKAVLLAEEPFLKKGFDCLIIGKKEILGSSFSVIKEVMQNSLKKICFYI
ncbi:MAG: ribonuclease P protein component [Patescibacteria group bacterium]|nr:ribonuclease P protein component [Patescibacteria group bacterium]